jgi:hypothetical protein
MQDPAAKETIMNCPTCGAETSPDARFCQSCGASLAPPSAPPATEAVVTATDRHAHLPPYWQEIFRRFDRQPTQMQTHWNWPAFFFGPFWYLFKGMPVKGAIYLLIVLGTYGVGIFLAVYSGLYGAWDYYLKEAKGKQLW